MADKAPAPQTVGPVKGPAAAPAPAAAAVSGIASFFRGAAGGSGGGAFPRPTQEPAASTAGAFPRPQQQEAKAPVAGAFPRPAPEAPAAKAPTAGAFPRPPAEAAPAAGKAPTAGALPRPAQDAGPSKKPTAPSAAPSPAPAAPPVAPAPSQASRMSPYELLYAGLQRASERAQFTLSAVEDADEDDEEEAGEGAEGSIPLGDGHASPASASDASDSGESSASDSEDSDSDADGDKARKRAAVKETKTLRKQQAAASAAAAAKPAPGKAKARKSREGASNGPQVVTAAISDGATGVVVIPRPDAGKARRGAGQALLDAVSSVAAGVATVATGLTQGGSGAAEGAAGDAGSGGVTPVTGGEAIPGGGLARFGSILKKGASTGLRAAAAAAAASSTGSGGTTPSGGAFPRGSHAPLDRESSASSMGVSDGDRDEAAEGALAAVTTGSGEEGAGTPSESPLPPAPAALRREASAFGAAFAQPASAPAGPSPFSARGRLRARAAAGAPAVGATTPAADSELARLAAGLESLLAEVPKPAVPQAEAAAATASATAAVAEAPSSADAEGSEGGDVTSHTAPPSPEIGPAAADDSLAAPLTSLLLRHSSARGAPAGGAGLQALKGAAGLLRRQGMQLARALKEGTAAAAGGVASLAATAEEEDGEGGLTARTAAGEAEGGQREPEEEPEAVLGRRQLTAALAAADLTGDGGDDEPAVTVTVRKLPAAPVLAHTSSPRLGAAPAPAPASAAPFTVPACTWPSPAATLALFNELGRCLAWGLATLPATHAALAPRLAAWAASFGPPPAPEPAPAPGGGKQAVTAASTAGPPPVPYAHASEASALLHVHASLSLSAGAWTPQQAGAFAERFAALLQPDVLCGLAAGCGDGAVVTALVGPVLTHAAGRNPRFGSGSAAAMHRALNIAQAQSDPVAAVRASPCPEAWPVDTLGGGSGGANSGGDGLFGSSGLAPSTTTAAATFATAVGADDEDGWLHPELASVALPPGHDVFSPPASSLADGPCDLPTTALTAWTASDPRKRLSKRALWALVCGVGARLLQAAPVTALMPVTPATRDDPPRPLPLPQLGITLHHWDFLMRSAPAHAGRLAASLVARGVVPFDFAAHTLTRLPRDGGESDGEDSLARFTGPPRTAARVFLSLCALHNPSSLTARAVASLLELLLSHEPPKPSSGVLWAEDGRTPAPQPQGLWACEYLCDAILAGSSSLAAATHCDPRALQAACWRHGYARGVAQMCGPSHEARMAQLVALSAHCDSTAMLSQALSSLATAAEASRCDDTAATLAAALLWLSVEAQCAVAPESDSEQREVTTARLLTSVLATLPPHVGLRAVSLATTTPSSQSSPSPHAAVAAQHAVLVACLPRLMGHLRLPRTPQQAAKALLAALPHDFCARAALYASAVVAARVASAALTVEYGGSLWREALSRRGGAPAPPPPTAAAYSQALASRSGLIDPQALVKASAAALLPKRAKRRRGAADGGDDAQPDAHRAQLQPRPELTPIV